MLHFHFLTTDGGGNVTQGPECLPSPFPQLQAGGARAPQWAPDCRSRVPAPQRAPNPPSRGVQPATLRFPMPFPIRAPGRGHTRRPLALLLPTRAGGSAWRRQHTPWTLAQAALGALTASTSATLPGPRVGCGLVSMALGQRMEPTFKADDKSEQRANNVSRLVGCEIRASR